jgi:hypothetical protein
VIVATLPTTLDDDLELEDLRRLNVIFPYYSSAYAVGDFVDLIAAYNDSIRATAAREKVVLVDLARDIALRPDRRKLFFDTMHPNQKGRIVIAEMFAHRISAVASARD